MQWAKALFCVVLVALVGMSVETAYGQTEERDVPWKIINGKALDAVSGDPTAIDKLANDVLNGSQLLEVLSATNVELKANRVSAELRYMAKKHSGVTDAKVADAMNALAKLAGAPAFAYTDKM